MNEKERHLCLSSLNEEQRQFLQTYIRQSKCDIWVEQLAQLKGIELNSRNDTDELNDFILVDVLDGGYGKRPHQCECGRALRFQYIVKHTRKEIEFKLGSECFKKFTNMDTSFVKDVKKGFNKVNKELDDILERCTSGTFNVNNFLIYADLMPSRYVEQLELNLPLSQKQEAKVEQLIVEKEAQLAQKELQETYEEIKDQLSDEQCGLLDSLSEDERHQVIIRMKNGEVIHCIEDIKNIDFEDIIDRNEILDKRSNKAARTQKKSVDQINYNTIIDSHRELLRAIHARSETIPSNLVKEWTVIRDMIERAKSGEDIDGGVLIQKLLIISNAIGIDVLEYYEKG
ncbi:hypothetical protein [Vallitalea okinawensis]|uniref:hypothetical protein n=1 Tax=Vallitalea okinawensis TaxID=2078660 RepID=UPI000CFCBCFC|nr:hypothetical protein [Vallitalea okinawensis]